MANNELAKLLEGLASSDHYLVEPRSALKLVKEASAAGKLDELKGLLERRKIRVPVPAGVRKRLPGQGSSGEESHEEQRVEYLSASELADALEEENEAVVHVLEKEGIKFPIKRIDATKLIVLIHGDEGFEESEPRAMAADRVGRRCRGYEC